MVAGDPEGRVKHAVNRNQIQRLACSFGLVYSALQTAPSNERGNMSVLLGPVFGEKVCQRLVSFTM